MSPRRPPRPWVGAPTPIDRSDLTGPRGLTEEVLREEEDDSPAPAGSPAFYWSMLTPERKARSLLDPHNTAAVLRTAEGLGLARAHVVPHDASDAIAHRRVTQDAHKWLDIDSHPSGAQAAQELRARGYEVWAGHLAPGARLYTEVPADRPLALLFGNEHEGPSPETLRACTGAFRIPMAGFTQSFNVSVAAAIALAQVTGARRRHLGQAGDLPEEERVHLRDRFTLLAARLAGRLKSRS